MNGIEHLIFQYCTSFVINLANYLGISYYETNFFIFCLLWPGVSLLLLAFALIQTFRAIRSLLRH